MVTMDDNGSGKENDDEYNSTNHTNHIFDNYYNNSNSNIINNNETRYLYTSNEDDEYNLTFKYDGCESTYSLPIMLLSIISFIFLFFTCCMLFEQIDAIESNTSKIARMKMRMGHADAHEYERVGQGFNEFFGGDSHKVSLHWFLPLPIRFPVGSKDRVMGFEYRDEWYGSVYQESMDDDEEEGNDEELGRKKGREDEERMVEMGTMGNDSGRKSSPLVLGKEEITDVNLDLPLASGNEDVKQRKTVVKRVSSVDVSNREKSGMETKLPLKIV